MTPQEKLTIQYCQALNIPIPETPEEWSQASTKIQIAQAQGVSAMITDTKGHL